MSMIIGFCEHGKLVAAAVEDASTETLEEMALCYRLERCEDAKFDGDCVPCIERYRANMKLLERAR